MNNPEEIIRFYLNRLETAYHPAEKRIIRDDLMLYYYRLSPQSVDLVYPLMKPVLEVLSKEVAESDPLLQKASELLNRLQNKPAFSH